MFETASFLRWSIKTCKLTSSVNTGAPPASWPHAYMLLCVWDGFTFDNKKRACNNNTETEWSHKRQLQKGRQVSQFFSKMDNLLWSLTFDLGKEADTNHQTGNNTQPLIAKFAHFSIACVNFYHFLPKCSNNFRAKKQRTQNGQTLQGQYFPLFTAFSNQTLRFY